jgi:hypothetical protein
MSTNFVHVVPRDPFFVPTPEVEDQARRWFGQAMPGGWEVTSTVMAPMGFVAAVEAGGDIHCPACGIQLDWQWVWSLLPDPPPEVVVPCCGRRVRLAELRGDFGECFARFYLRITDPDAWAGAPAEVLAGVEAILGVPVASVLQRI